MISIYAGRTRPPPGKTSGRSSSCCPPLRCPPAGPGCRSTPRGGLHCRGEGRPWGAVAPLIPWTGRPSCSSCPPRPSCGAARTARISSRRASGRATTSTPSSSRTACGVASRPARSWSGRSARSCRASLPPPPRRLRPRLYPPPLSPPRTAPAPVPAARSWAAPCPSAWTRPWSSPSPSTSGRRRCQAAARPRGAAARRVPPGRAGPAAAPGTTRSATRVSAAGLDGVGGAGCGPAGRRQQLQQARRGPGLPPHGAGFPAGLWANSNGHGVPGLGLCRAAPRASQCPHVHRGCVCAILGAVLGSVWSEARGSAMLNHVRWGMFTALGGWNRAAARRGSLSVRWQSLKCPQIVPIGEIRFGSVVLAV